jgi:hypothetical protein
METPTMKSKRKLAEHKMLSRRRFGYRSKLYNLSDNINPKTGKYVPYQRELHGEL